VTHEPNVHNHVVVPLPWKGGTNAYGLASSLLITSTACGGRPESAAQGRAVPPVVRQLSVRTPAQPVERGPEDRFDVRRFTRDGCGGEDEVEHLVEC